MGVGFLKSHIYVLDTLVCVPRFIISNFKT